VVASANGGVPEVLRDGQEGRLYPSGDSAALAAALESIFRNEPETDRLARAARARAQEQFGAAAFAGNLMNFYAEVLGAAPAPVAAPGFRPTWREEFS
jgi:glycosyltransferase involved in cell wall biosynthesis